MADRRQLGGASNKRGNRYEDNFAVYSLLKLACRHPAPSPGLIRVKEQAGCPVDDFLQIEDKLFEYAQLKSGAQVTWESRQGKLRQEFEQQIAQCEGRHEQFKLALVVAEAAQQQALQQNLPASIAPHTRVRYFPYGRRVTELRRAKPRVDDLLAGLAATRFRSPTELEHLLLAFQSAWINHDPDSDGYCDLANLLDVVRNLRGPRLRGNAMPPLGWSQAAGALSAIPGLEFWIDRGFFEFRFPPSDQGLYPEPLDSPSFARYVGRILEKRPATFEQFEELWP